MSQALNQITDLVKALEAGNYDAAPSTLVQGAALQVEDLTSVMNNVTFDTSHIKLQKMIKTESCKSTLAQFDRQLSYGQFGGAAQFEGNIGQEDTSDFVRVVVPMTFYSKTRRVTIASTMVATVDGKKSDERAASDAATQMAGELEFDMFRGMDDFSNAGVFDGNPLVIPTETMPNMHGLGLQVRQSDYQANSKDLMFAEFGSDDTVVLSAGGVAITQSLIEDAALRSSLGFGNASKLVTDLVALSQYNKITFGKERIILGGSPQDATGGDLRKQWVSGGTVSVEASQFLRGKSKPQRPRSNGPAAPASLTAVAGSLGSTGLSGAYVYYATAGNEIGESLPCTAVTTATITLNYSVVVTISNPGSGTWRFFNVYRSAAGGSSASARFIGRVKASNAATTVFTDLGNKVPGYTTAYLLQEDGAVVKELSPYSRLKLAVVDLSSPECYFRFASLAVITPRKYVILDNVAGK